MSVCQHRPEECGFFTGCKACPCGLEVQTELAAEIAAAAGGEGEGE